jgi:2-methylisocitrate lyase-like PEP mutase family enzyme
LLDVGVSGINIEDGTDSPDLLCSKIEAVRKRAVDAGVEVFINARTDVYLRNLASGKAAVEEVLRRAARCRAAGCDGIFVPGLADASEMAEIAKAIDPMPLNVMARPGLPSLDALENSGVRRLSAGSAIAQASLGCSSRLAAGFLAGKFGDLFTASAPYGFVNQLFVDRA